MASEGKPLKVGNRVEVIGKGIIGSVAYVGATQFASGMYMTQQLQIHSDNLFCCILHV